MTFASLRLAEPLLVALTGQDYTTPTPIQAKAIPPILEGKDLLGCAQTGTGKTAAFSLPLLQRVMLESPHRPSVEPHRKRQTRALILSPTRELASQIGQSIRTYGGQTGVRYAVIFGGVGQHAQVEALRSGVDVLIATPGRLLDLMNQGHVDLRHIEFFVLDEADRMLDMGFIHDIRKVVTKLPPKRQNLMFSATMPTEIRKLADSILHHPVYIEIAPVASTADLIEQSVCHVAKGDKPSLLAHLYHDLPMARTLVFTRTKHGADRLVRKLRGSDIHAEAIHGDKAQNARQRSLSNFKSGKIPMLVATDIAARGIDVDGVTHVINFDIPNEPETYVHRIGRTGRAGASGVAIAFCDHGDERGFLRDIEKLIRKKIEVRGDLPKFAPAPKEPAHAGKHSEHRSAQPARHQHGDRPRANSHPRAGGHPRANDQHSQKARHPQPHSTSHDRAAGERAVHSREQRHPQIRTAAHEHAARGAHAIASMTRMISPPKQHKPAKPQHGGHHKGGRKQFSFAGGRRKSGGHR